MELLSYKKCLLRDIFYLDMEKSLVIYATFEALFEHY